MREDVARLVFPVLRGGIEIRDKVRSRAGALQFAEGHNKLLGLLQAPVPEALRSEFEGDAERLRDASMTGRPEVFLGMRYALACWLDEMFILDSPWRELWSDNKIETKLYHMNLRSSKFWEQAERARGRTTRDALEVYYLCVMLGFRGDLRGKPGELKSWREQAEAQITEAEDGSYVPPPALALVPEVPRLRGARRKRTWLLVLLSSLVLFVLALLVVLGSRF